MSPAQTTLRGPALGERLAAWREAGLIAPEQADAILRFEAEAAAPASRVPLAAEAVGYVGAALIVAAVVSLVANHFDDMAVGARVAVLGVPAVGLAALGWWVGKQRDPALERLGSVVWALSTALLAGTIAEVVVDVVNDRRAPDHGMLLAVGGGACVWAGVAYALRRLPLQLLALFVASIPATLGVVDVVEAAGGTPVASWIWATALWLLGVAWFLAGAAGRVTPRAMAMLLGAALALVATQTLWGENADAGIWLGLATALALVAFGVWRADLVSLFAGTAGLFQWAPQLAVHYLADTLGTEATLALVGVVLLGVAAGFTRIYRRMRGAGAARAS